MIKRIHIQNFRSLLDVTVDLDPLTVLIGRSGTGKSNFVQAIRFLRDSLATRAINFNQPGAVPRIFHVEHDNDPLVYEVEFEIKGLSKDFRYRLEFNPKKGQYGEKLEIGGDVLFHHTEKKWIVTPKVIPPPAPNGIMLGAIPGLQESTFAYVALRSGIGCYDFPSDILVGPGSKGALADSGFTDRGDNYLLVADRILSDLSKAEAWKRIATGMRAINKTVGSLTLNVPTPDRLDVGHQLNGRLLSFDVRQESEGFRRFLAHLLALYQNPSKQTLLFEHPELGLHPGALESLAEEFKDCPDDGRGQVILTTHSPQLLDYFPVESIRVVAMNHMQTQLDRLRQNNSRPSNNTFSFPVNSSPLTLPDFRANSTRCLDEPPCSLRGR